MLTGALSKCRHVPGWERTFFSALEQGYSERTAATTAGVGAGNIKSQCEKYPAFKAKYEAALVSSKQRKPPMGGLY